MTEEWANGQSEKHPNSYEVLLVLISCAEVPRLPLVPILTSTAMMTDETWRVEDVCQTEVLQIPLSQVQEPGDFPLSVQIENEGQLTSQIRPFDHGCPLNHRADLRERNPRQQGPHFEQSQTMSGAVYCCGKSQLCPQQLYHHLEWHCLWTNLHELDPQTEIGIFLEGVQMQQIGRHLVREGKEPLSRHVAFDKYPTKSHRGVRMA
jgi:hypothetical protein